MKKEKKPLTRVCPDCKEIIEYKRREACRAAERNNSTCKSCAVKKDYLNNPKKNKAENNGRFGKKLINVMKEKHGEIVGEEKYNTWKENLNSFKSSVNNPQFGKPGWKNSGMSYMGWYKGMFFRSSFELLFLYDYMEENKKLPESAEQKKYMVTYYIDKIERNYFPDYYCNIKNCVYEIKSESFLKTESNKLKQQAALNHFNEQNIEYEVITEKKLKTFNELNSWQKVIYHFLYNLYLENEITLTDKSIKKLKNGLYKQNNINKIKKLEENGK